MTVTYTSEVTTSTGLGCFLKLLRRWRGSIYKIVWPNLLLFLVIYYILNLTYVFILDPTWKRSRRRAKSSLKSPISLVYEAVHLRHIPIEFEIIEESGPANKRVFVTKCMLGHLYTTGVGRSKKESKKEAAKNMLERISELPMVSQDMQVNSIIKQDKKKKKKNKILKTNVDVINMQIEKIIKEYGLPFTSNQDERAKIIRRTIARYVCVTFTMTLTLISPKVKKRFPTLNHYVKAGLITPQEKKLMEQLDNEYPSYTKYWLPLAWAASVSTRARHEGIITSDLGVKGILDELNIFRSKCGGMLDYDWISVPLVYTQVVTLAVYGYFLVTVIGYQFIGAEGNYKEQIIFSFPFMPIIEFFFYIGWLKVAETLINPFGDDDDDFEVVWMIDRHIQVCFLLVDKIHQEHPTLGKDAYWDETAPTILPFTVASQDYMNEYPECSTENVHVKNTDQDFIIPEYSSQTDGESPRRGSGLWRLAKRKRRKGKVIKGFHLKKVSTHSLDANNFDETNTYEEFGPNKVTIPPLNRPRPEQHSEEFERLREERLKKRKEKLLKCVGLLKLDNEGRRKVIDEIVK